jgi:uncharacterized caspase-like protein
MLRNAVEAFMQNRAFLPIVLGLLAALLLSGQARAERRIALVIGNAQYANANPLRNPVNDAQDVAAVLKTLGFDVLLGLDLDQVSFARKIDEFARALDRADVGLFWYAGHGLQINEKNYLVSTSAKLESEFLIPSETIELDAVIRLMESKAPVNLVFLDACRNNPLADNLKRSLTAQRRSVALGRGLAKIEPTGHDTLVAFSAAPDQEAADGTGRNSPFAIALMKHMPEKGLEVSVMLKLVAADVRQATQNEQRPQQLSDMTQTFYFAKAEPAPSAPAPSQAAAPPPASPPATNNDAIELAFWQSAMTANSCEAVRAYLKRFPNGTFVDLAKLNERQLCTPGSTATATAPPTEPPASIPRKLAPPPVSPPPPAAAPPSAKQPAKPPARASLQRRQARDQGQDPPRERAPRGPSPSAGVVKPPGSLSSGSTIFEGGRKCRTVDMEGTAPHIVCD